MHTSHFLAAIPKQIESNEILKEERKAQLRTRKLLYQWQDNTDIGLPSSIQGSELPDDEKFGFTKSVDFYKDVFEGAAKTQLAGLFTTVDDLGDYSRV